MWENDNRKLADMSATDSHLGYLGFNGCLQTNMTGPNYPNGPVGYDPRKSSSAQTLMEKALGMCYGSSVANTTDTIFYLNYVNKTIGSSVPSYAPQCFPYSNARKDGDLKLIMEAEAVRDSTGDTQPCFCSQS